MFLTIGYSFILLFFILNEVQTFANTRSDAKILLSKSILEEILTIPDKGIPSNLLEDAHAIGIFPNVKMGGYILGIQFGQGIITHRDVVFRMGVGSILKYLQTRLINLIVHCGFSCSGFVLPRDSD